MIMNSFHAPNWISREWLIITKEGSSLLDAYNSYQTAVVSVVPVVFSSLITFTYPYGRATTTKFQSFLF